MSLLKRLLTSLGTTLIVALLIMGYFGFVPGLSDIMGSNKPHDLGVRYTATDLDSVNAKLGLTYKVLPITALGAASLSETGSKPVDTTITQEELTALINDHAAKWKYYPIEDAQVKINQNGAIELSGILLINRWEGYADSIKLPNDVRSQARPLLNLALSNPSVYMRGTLSISGYPQLTIQEVRLGYFPVPENLVQSYGYAVEAFVDYAANFYNLKIRTATFSGGQLRVVAQLPQEIGLAPPIKAASIVWTPTAASAISSIILSSIAMIALNSSWMEKIKSILPDAVRKWFEDFYASKSEMALENKTGQILTITKKEALSYVIALTTLTLAFSYSSVDTLDKIISAAQIVLATSIIVEFTKNYLITVTARSMKIWTEHRIWFSGLATFIVSTIAFKAPFSSPSRNVQHSANVTERSTGLLATLSIVFTLVFAMIFYELTVSGISNIGEIGLGMCLLAALFDSIPIKPMNGSDVYVWNKVISVLLFLITLALNIYWLFLL